MQVSIENVTEDFNQQEFGGLMTMRLLGHHMRIRSIFSPPGLHLLILRILLLLDPLRWLRNEGADVFVDCRPAHSGMHVPLQFLRLLR